jgi:hypothetical protein
MNDVNGLQWIWGDKEIIIINRSRHPVYITPDGSCPIFAVNTGCWTVYPFTGGGVSMSYYTDTRDLRSVCIRANGSWATSVTKMVHPSCYTKDREMKVQSISRRNAGKPY